MVLERDPLELLDQPVSLRLVVAGRPVVREVVEQLGLVVESEKDIRLLVYDSPAASPPAKSKMDR